MHHRLLPNNPQQINSTILLTNLKILMLSLISKHKIQPSVRLEHFLNKIKLNNFHLPIHCPNAKDLKIKLLEIIPLKEMQIIIPIIIIH